MERLDNAPRQHTHFHGTNSWLEGRKKSCLVMINSNCGVTTATTEANWMLLLGSCVVCVVVQLLA